MKKIVLSLLFLPLMMVSQSSQTTSDTIYPTQYADTIIYIVTDVTCHGGSDGSVVIDVRGSNHPYFFEWNNSGTSVPNDNERNNLAASTHLVTITDVNGGLVDNSYINYVEEPPNFSVYETITDPSCFNYSDGAIDLIITGSVPYSAPPFYMFSWNDGVSTKNRSSLVSGSYFLTITDSRGCYRVDTFTLDNPSKVNSTVINDTLACIGDCDGQAFVIPSDGFSPYTYVWDDPLSQITDTAFNLCYGNYTVYITDSNGCLDTNYVFIENPDTLQVDVLVDPACYDICDGELSISIQGGTGPYGVSWNLDGVEFDSTSMILDSLCPDIYELVYNDEKGCQEIEMIHLTERIPFNLVYPAVVDDSCFNSCTGKITAHVLDQSDHNPPFIYSWSNGGMDSVASNLCAGPDTLWLFDSRGCVDTFYFFVDEPLPLSIDSFVIEDNLCYGEENGSISVDISGGTGTIFTLWVGSDSTYNTEDISNLSSGSYTLHIEDQNLCVKDTFFTVVDPDSLFVAASVQDVSCYLFSDGIIEVTIQGGVSPYLISWNVGIPDTTYIDSLSYGEYVYTVIDSNNCPISDTLMINQPEELLLEDSITDILCHGYSTGSIDLTVSGGTPSYSYSWSNGSTNEDLLPPLNAGVYTVDVVDQNGCFILSTYTVSEPFFPLSASLDTGGILCFSYETGSIDLTVSGGTNPYSYQWSNSEVTQDIFNLSAGYYEVTIVDENGCDTVSNIILIEPSEILVTAQITDLLCFEDASGEIDVTVSGGVPNTSSPFYFYSWDNGSISEDLQNLDAGVYTLTVTDLNSCLVNTSFIVNEPDLLSLSSVNTHVTCFNGTDGEIDLIVSGGTSPFLYNWSHGISNEDLNNLGSNIYSVVVTDKNNCSANLDVTINEPDQILIDGIVVDSDCYDEDLGYIEITVTGGTGVNYSFSWNGPDGFNSSLEDIYNLGYGQYSVQVFDEVNCSNAEFFIVNSPPAIWAIASVDDVICYGGNTGSISLTHGGGYGNLTYLWNTGQNINPIDNLFLGDYSVVITDENNCTKELDVMVSEPNDIIVNYTVTSSTCEENNDGAIYLNVSGGVLPYSYYWSDGFIGKDNIDISKGDYSVEVIDGNGCNITELISVGFDGFDGCIEIPSGFSPNSDGVHDEWAIYGLSNFPDVEVNVYNRWGERIFYSQGYTTPWDGKRNGIDLPIATYYYVIELNDSEKMFNGTVTIKR